MISEHLVFMNQAYLLAEQAFREGEVPVGALIVKQGQILGKGYNQTENLKDATAHAEMIAISAACASLNQKYLTNCTLYVTLEPCPMCAGAIVWSKLERVVFGAPDEKAGACGSLLNIASNKKLNHQTEIIQGVMEDDCRDLMKRFFNRLRG